MELDKEKTKVYFRIDFDGVVFALFPELNVGSNYCTSYQHVGQHGGADFDYCMLQSHPATPHDYEPLKEELTERGYNLEIL